MPTMVVEKTVMKLTWSQLLMVEFDTKVPLTVVILVDVVVVSGGGVMGAGVVCPKIVVGVVLFIN
jgi:hypothetical protein